MLRSWSVLALLVGVPVNDVGAQTTRANPKIDAIFATWARADAPGCTVGVLQNGRFTYRKGYGSANLDYSIPNSPDLVYYVGSVSKQFTAAAIALLSLEGRISLDDDIRKYFPEMRDYGRPITVRQMVYHTSGLRDIYTLMALGGLRLEDVMTDSTAVTLIASQRELNFAPGDDHLYSNSGYFLLGQLVRRVTGKSLREYADEKMFKPLGMTRTHFHDDPGHVMPKRAVAYEADTTLPGRVRIGYVQNFDKIGAGGLYTTLDDLQKWDANYYHMRVGGEALQRIIHTRAVLTKGDTLPYAFGNNVSTHRGLRVTEHTGALMGYRAALVRFPDQQTSVVLMCNLGSIDPGDLAYRVADVVLGHRMSAPVARSAAAARSVESPVALSDEDRRALPGRYSSEEVFATYNIRAAANGDLILHVPNAAGAPMRKLGENRFRAAGLIVHAVRGADGQVTALSVDAGRVRNIRFARR